MLSAQSTAAAPMRPSRRGYRLRSALIAYLFQAPFLVLFALFFLLPIFYALSISPYVDRLIGGTVFVGSQNYVNVFQDSNFWTGTVRMFELGVVQIPVMLGLALAFALLLDSKIVRFRTLFRLAFFLPYAIPEVVAALLWGYMYGPSFGVFAQIAGWFHLSAPDFLSESWMLPSIGNIVTWQWTGYNMVVLYAALTSIPPDLYESAQVEGAGGWAIARYIKIPLVAPALIVTFLFSIIGVLQTFSVPQILRYLAPDVIGDHYTPNLYSYYVAFTNQQYNYSAALSFVLAGVVFVASYTFMLAVNRGEAFR